MRITGLDTVAMALGAVAVMFSGFVLAHSAWGGVALFAGGVTALSIAPIRARSPSLVPVTWIVVLLFLSAGFAGFLVGFGVFDAPHVQHDAEATLHDDGTDDATVIVTGVVENRGDGPATVVTVDVTLYDDTGDPLAGDVVEVRSLSAGSEQQFFVRFGPDSELSALESFAIELTVEP